MDNLLDNALGDWLIDQWIWFKELLEELWTWINSISPVDFLYFLIGLIALIITVIVWNGVRAEANRIKHRYPS